MLLRVMGLHFWVLLLCAVDGSASSRLGANEFVAACSHAKFSPSQGMLAPIHGDV
jgi:hypothetical protein